MLWKLYLPPYSKNNRYCIRLADTSDENYRYNHPNLFPNMKVLKTLYSWLSNHREGLRHLLHTIVQVSFWHMISVQRNVQKRTFLRKCLWQKRCQKHRLPCPVEKLASPFRFSNFPHNCAYSRLSAKPLLQNCASRSALPRYPQISDIHP